MEVATRVRVRALRHLAALELRPAEAPRRGTPCASPHRPSKGVKRGLAALMEKRATQVATQGETPLLGDLRAKCPITSYWSPSGLRMNPE